MTDFSKQSRMRLNEAFSSLRKILENSDDFSKTFEWNRFLILERATNFIVKIITGQLGHAKIDGIHSKYFSQKKIVWQLSRK